MVSAFDKALEMTLEIAKALPPATKQNHKLYKKTVQSIFDDQLKMNTKLNRFQRRKARKQLDKALKEHGIV